MRIDFYGFSDVSFGRRTAQNNIFIGNGNAKNCSEIVCGEVDQMRTREYIKNTLQEYMYNDKLWIDTFPDVKKYLIRDYPTVNDSIIKNNLLYNCSPLLTDIADGVINGETTEIADNYETSSDPGFVSLSDKNFRLRDDSEVFAHIPDFINPDMAKMGRAVDSAESIIGDCLVLRTDSPLCMKNGMAEATNGIPYQDNLRTMIPAELLARIYNAEYNYDEANNTLIINGKSYSNFTVKNDVIYLPLNSLSEALGKKYFWDENGLIIFGGNENMLDKVYDKNEIIYLYDKLNMY